MAKQSDAASLSAAREPQRIRQLRQSKRRVLAMTVNLIVDGAVSHLTLDNVSATGMGLRGWSELSCNRDAQVQLPDGRLLAARVCWVGNGCIGVTLMTELQQDDPLLQSNGVVAVPEPRHHKPVGATARLPFRLGARPNAAAGNAILVADAFRSIGCLMKGILEKAGNTVDVVDNGLAVVEAARLKPYDVVVIDSQLSLMSAAAVVARLRQLPAPFGRCSIIALSSAALDARSGAAAFDGAFDGAVDGYVTKPIRPAVLLEQVAAVRARRVVDAMHRLVATVSNAA